MPKRFTLYYTDVKLLIQGNNLMLPKTWQLRILKWLGSGYYFEQGDRLYSVSEVEVNFINVVFY